MGHQCCVHLTSVHVSSKPAAEEEQARKHPRWLVPMASASKEKWMGAVEVFKM
jgi:hypothetical protein